jgi:MFS family permease
MLFLKSIIRRGDSELKPTYYGWRITFTLAITETISWGILYYAFTVFLKPMQADLGWSSTQLTGGFSLCLLVTGIMAFPVGTWIDKHGPRFLMTTGSILASLLVFAWSRVTDVTTYYLIWFGLGWCSAAVLYEPAFAVIASWFAKRRGKALAIITFAAGLASTIFIPLSNGLLNVFGWRTAILLLAGLLAATTIPLHALVLRRRPADLGLLPDGGPITANKPHRLSGKSLSEALHSRYFWLLTFTFSLGSLAAAAMRVHFIPFLTDSGVDANTAAFASGSIGLMQVAGRLVFAPLEQRVSVRALIAGVFALECVAVAVLLFGTSLWMVAIFIILFGASYGAVTLARTTAIADQYGSSHYGRISSVMTIFLTAAATVAPVGAAFIHDQFKSYSPVLWIIIVLMMVASTVAFLTRQPVRITPMHVVFEGETTAQ